MKQVKVKPSKINNAGKGVYAESLYRKGDRVCEYAGNIMDKKLTMDMYLMDRSRYLQEIHPYARDLDEKRVIIGDRSLEQCGFKAGVYVNDAGCLNKVDSNSIASYKSTEQKCNVKSVRYDDRLYYVATKRIKRGEELYAHYGVHYWLLLNNVPAEQLKLINL